MKVKPVVVQEGDPEGWWEESFNGHSDTKPKGPEALSLDISFPGFSHVYGIPERATRLALKPTAGEGSCHDIEINQGNLATHCTLALAARDTKQLHVFEQFSVRREHVPQNGSPDCAGSRGTFLLHE